MTLKIWEAYLVSFAFLGWFSLTSISRSVALNVLDAKSSMSLATFFELSITFFAPLINFFTI